MYLLTQLTRLELGDFLLDLTFELGGDYESPDGRSAFERHHIEASSRLGIVPEEGLNYPNPQASEWAGERAKFADFLSTLPKMSTGIGESQFFKFFTPCSLAEPFPCLDSRSFQSPSVLLLRVFPLHSIVHYNQFSHLLSRLNLAAGRMPSLYRSLLNVPHINMIMHTSLIEGFPCRCEDPDRLGRREVESLDEAAPEQA